MDKLDAILCVCRAKIEQNNKYLLAINQSMKHKILQQIISRRKKQKHMSDTLSFSLHSAFHKYFPEGRIQHGQLSKPVIIIQPIQKQSEQNNLDHSSALPIIVSANDHIISKEEQQSDVSEQSMVKNDNRNLAQIIERLQSPELKKRRKNKLETKIQIAKKQRDEGRGGNCIASNITKTLFRIIQIKLNKKVFNQFKTITERYKIKSQKQNTIILLLILYVFVKQGKLDLTTFEEIFTLNFLKSLKESKNNCEKKMEEETERINFHHKNKKMYSRFIEINTELFENLKQGITQGSMSQLKLEKISEIIADTYDRKQRQIQKAMSKIKSIILNHKELKEIFALQETDIEEAFLQSIEYAYRRNLQKRCKQAKFAVHKFIDEFQKSHNLKSDQDKYFMCYLALRLIGQKEKQIWDEFIINLNMKSEFNNSEAKLNQLTDLLQKIPEQISDMERTLKKDFSSFKSDGSTMDVQPACDSRVLEFYNTYLSLKNNFQP